MSHPDAGELLLLTEGELSPSRQRQVVAHLKSCERCRDQCACLLALKEHGEDLRAQHARRAVIGSTAAAFVVIAFVAFLQPDASPVGPPDLSHLQSLERIDGRWVQIRYGIMSPVGAAASGADVGALSSALDVLLDGNPSTAVPLLRQLRSEYPHDPEVPIFLGWALYLSGDRSPEVVPLLEDGVRYWDQDANIGQYSMLYLASCLLGPGGDISRAAEMLEELITASNNTTSRRARVMLDQIPREYHPH